MKTIFILLLFPFLFTAQIKVNEKLTIPDDALHFYGVYAVGELSHGLQTLIYKDRTFAKKLLVDWCISQFVIFGKEVFDVYKANPTGFGGYQYSDIFVGQFGVHIRLMVKVSLNDFKQVGFVPRKKKHKYSLKRDL